MRGVRASAEAHGQVPRRAGAGGNHGVPTDEAAEQVTKDGAQRGVMSESTRGGQPRTGVVEWCRDGRVTTGADAAHARDDGEQIGDHGEEPRDGEKRERER